MEVYSVEELEKIAKLPADQQEAIFKKRREEMELEAAAVKEATERELAAAADGFTNLTGEHLTEMVKEALAGDQEAQGHIEDLSTNPDTKELLSLLIEVQELKNRYGDDVIKGLLGGLKSERETPEDTKEGYRTAAKAGDIVKQYPQALAIPTLPTYNNAMSLNPGGNAYLTPLPGIEGLKFKDGKMYFDNSLIPVGEAQLQNMKTKENISNIDLQLLRTFYAIILNETCKANKKIGVVTLFVPDFATYLGRKNLTEERVNDLVKQVQQFHNIVGLIKTAYGDSIFPVLNFEGYDKKKNTISFYSPYMNYVIGVIMEKSIRKDTKGKPKLKKNGEPLRLPSHSYAIKSDLVKERNKYAAENVIIIVTTIEQAGGNGAHISATTIIDRNPQLKEALDNSKNKRQLLKRCFTKTLELLREKTLLTEIYKDIELPDPTDPANIPTEKTLYTTVYTITHKGKKKP